jgi:glycosyltransferase involved in cell wall biosynthesis
MKSKSSLSIVIPIFNEESNIPALLAEIQQQLQDCQYEVIAVDDGSTDRSLERLLEFRESDDRLRVIKLNRNYGQTAAMEAGFQSARNEIVVTMDADLQNPPTEIGKVVAEVEAGSDVACGWRVERHDSFAKKLLSRMAYGLRRMVLSDEIHDAGCTLKAYRRETLTDLPLFGEMHRFIHVLLKWRGCKVTEVPVAHGERIHGETKYGLSRLIKGLLDLIVVKFWLEYSSRPIYLFGGIGLGLTAAGIGLAVYLAAIKIFFDAALSGRPLLLLAILLIVLGAQFVFFGLLADVIAKVYYGTGDHKHVIIEKSYE